MSDIKLDNRQKEEIVDKIKKYFDSELNQDIGQFDAEFLLDFFTSQVGAHFYNQGLADAGALFESKLEDIQHNLYELEKPIT